METKKSFLGIELPNWIAIIGLTLTVFVTLLSASVRVANIESQTMQNTLEISSCKVEIKEAVSDVSEIKGDIKAINGKLDIILQRTK